MQKRTRQFGGVRMPEHLSEALAHALLSQENIDLNIVEETGSTNDDLKAIARRRAFERPYFLSAKRQTCGRGTQGRCWHTASLSLLFSLGIGLQAGAVQGLLSIAVGLGVADAARNFGLGVQLKWPNDIWTARGKAGGILCETVRDPYGDTSLIIGVGCNLKIDAGGMTTNGWPITDLAQAGGGLLVESTTSRTAFLCGMVLAILSRFDRLMAGDMQTLLADWAVADAFFGREVCWTSCIGSEEQRGIDRGIDSLGRLIIEPLSSNAEISKERLFLSGELSALTNQRNG